MQKAIICPECRSKTMIKFDGEELNYSLRTFRYDDFTWPEFRQNLIILVEVHKDHIISIDLDKKDLDSNYSVSKDGISEFQYNVNAILNAIKLKFDMENPIKILILSKFNLWMKFLGNIYGELISKEENLSYISHFKKDRDKIDMKFQSFNISYDNTLENKNGKYNVIITDHQNLNIEEFNNKLKNMFHKTGTFVVTVNMDTENEIPKIEMEDYNKIIKDLKLNFKFINVTSIEQMAITMLQLLQK